MSPNISVREYIRWLPDDASEPTTTIVLNSAEHRYVDIRLLKESEDGERTQNIVHSSHIDWAIAGTSSSEIKHDPEAGQIVHSTWHHWIDSRTLDPESATDEGDMFPLPNGRTLEKGSMPNPATGRMTDYEECWLDVEPIATSADGDGKRVCTVLRLEDDNYGHGARGMVVRVGQFCQGILRMGDGLTLERWEWDTYAGWTRKARSGDLFIPCGVTLEGEKLKLGGKVTFGDTIWEVVEMTEF